MDKLPESKQTDVEAKSLVDQYTRDFDNISSIRNTWEDKEAMLLGVPTDSQSKSTKSKVFDPRLSTIVFERAARVAAQTPTGRVQALTRADAGKNQLMNLVLTKYIYPNAKTQFDLLTKMRLLDVYSNVYGSFGWLVDYHVRPDYVGPDVSLIPIRNIIPQSGKHNDLDYCFVRSVVSKKWLLSRDTKNWKNIDKLLEQSSNKGAIQDTDYDSFSEKTYNQQGMVNPDKDDFEQIEIITRYEPDRWITFSKDAKLILRDIKNPQCNGKLPVIMKHAFPVVDRFFGLGEFERGQTLQMAINSLINLYLDGVKMSIFPPLKVYLPDLVAKTINYEPAAKWVLKNNNPNAITQMQFSPQGLSSFNSTYNFLLAALSNQAGTTDTSISSDADITQGKTPQALKMMAGRENARDSWDRFMLEKSLEETFDRFVDLVATRQEKPIKLHLFKEEMEMISQSHPDLAEMYESGEYGEVVIKPDNLTDKEKKTKKSKDGKDEEYEERTTKYKFFIDQGTTLKKEEVEQNQSLTAIFGLIFKIPGALEQAMESGKVTIGTKVIHVDEALSRWIQTSGLTDSDKIISEMTPEEEAEKEAQVQAMMQQAIQQQIGQGQPAMPGQPMQGGQPMPQQGQPVNFEDPNMQSLMGGNDPVAKIMSELQGAVNGGV